MTNWHLGTMGFSYKAWLGPFYPAGMAQRNYLSYYAERFNAVEMDSTFYGTPTPETVRRWTAVTPPTFIICPKVPRAITHELGLQRAREMTRRFIDTMRLLGDQLGPILLQLPPGFTYAERGTLSDYLRALPADLRWAVEFRHRTWTRPETAVLLRDQNICLVAADYIHMPKRVVPTTDFLYLRFLGRHGQFAAKDQEQVDKTAVLEGWWTQIQPLLEGMHAVYGFFNNDYAGFSPGTCNRFKRIAGIEPQEIRPLQQGRLF